MIFAISVICYLCYDVHWFCFWVWKLSTERVVAQPPFISFPPRVNAVVAYSLVFYYAIQSGCVYVL